MTGWDDETGRDDETFLDRWSRRKRSGGAAPVVAPPATEIVTATAAEAPVAAERRRGPPLPHAARLPRETPADEAAPATDEPVAELPDIDSLDKDSDYTAFMRDGVPEHLRRQALRKLWLASPVHSIIDGLDDYDDDFTLQFTDAVTKNVKSSFRVGKGFAPDDEAIEKAEDAVADAEADEATDDAADDDAETPADDRRRTPEPLAEAGDAAGDVDDPDATG